MGDREENSLIEALNFSYSHDMDDAQLPLGLTFPPLLFTMHSKRNKNQSRLNHLSSVATWVLQ